MAQPPEEWFQQKINFVSGENCKDTLIEIKSGIAALTADHLTLLSKQNLNIIFQYIQVDQEEESELACEILLVLLSLLEPSIILNTYGLAIQNALSHPSAKVKRQFLNLLLQCTSTECLSVLVSALPGVFTQVLECLTCSDRTVAEGSVQFFKKIGRCSQGVGVLFNEPLVVVLKQIMQTNDIVRFRVYEICVDAAVNAEGGLEAGHRAAILSSLLAELKSSDPLLQLNALELLTSLATTSDGFLYLQREGVVNYLVDLISNIQSQPLSFILLPGLIEFFGNLSMRQPAVFAQQHPEVLTLLFDSFETLDPALLGVVITTIGKIGSSDEGKRVLMKDVNKMQGVLQKIGEVIQRKDALCVTGLSTLNVLLTTQDNTLSECTHGWFQALGPQAWPNLINTCKLPFVELRLAALLLLNCVSRQPWGPQLICQTPGLVEFLLDRDVEFNKDCKLAKFDVVTSLTSNPKLSVSSDFLLKLKQHVNEGAFYVPAQLLTEVEQA